MIYVVTLQEYGHDDTESSVQGVFKHSSNAKEKAIELVLFNNVCAHVHRASSEFIQEFKNKLMEFKQECMCLELDEFNKQLNSITWKYFLDKIKTNLPTFSVIIERRNIEQSFKSNMFDLIKNVQNHTWMSSEYKDRLNILI